MKNRIYELLRILFIKGQKRRMKLTKTFLLLVNMYSESVIQYGRIVSRFTNRRLILISFVLSS